VNRSSAALLCLVAAVLGGLAALVGAKATGLVGRDVHTVVVDRLPAGGTAAPVVAPAPLAGAFSPAEIYRDRAAGVVTVLAYFDASGTVSGGQGSGFVVAANGTILTNAHVVTTAGQTAVGSAAKPARKVYVEFDDGDRVTARIVGYDLYDDVAVLHVDPAQHRLTPVPLGDSSRVVVGEPVAAIGSPFGNVGSLTVGVVSATRRSIPSLTTSFALIDAIQTDAAINHGNSGGPLFDAAGRVIGINAQIKSSTGSTGSEGVGFAVPIDSARRSMDELLRTGRVSYAYVGVSTEDLTPSVAKRAGYAVAEGAIVDAVTPGGPGARAGLRAGSAFVPFDGEEVRVGGDVIVAIDGIRVRTSEDVVRIVAERLVPGERARFTVVRGGRRRRVAVVLGARPEQG
jgi:S1-C subfamily serine protease